MEQSKKKSEVDLAERAYQEILRLLSQSELSETDVVSHRALAEKLHMSKLPVGQALKRLSNEGLTESINRVGTRVCKIDADSFWNMFQWRVAIECQCARLASEWMNDEQGEALIDLGASLDNKEEVGHTNETFQRDVDFHLMLADFSGSSRLRAELERLDVYQVKLAICEAVSAAATEPSRLLMSSHEKLARAIVIGPADKAEEAIRNHLENSTKVYGFLKWYKERKRKKIGQG